LLKNIFFPPATPSKHDTGLRFTDILFGFVIKELFVRLQNWGAEPWYIRWQLLAGTILVLGSWIGYRRSLSRSTYELKFFNLPLARFVVDQAMLVLYFRLAILTPNQAHPKTDPSGLTHATTETLLIIFGLYLVWDIGALLMSIGSKYPLIDEASQAKTDTKASQNWPGLLITAAFLGLFAALYCVAEGVTIKGTQADTIFMIATGLLLAYRFAKEIRTSVWRPVAVVAPTAEPSGTAGV
jgi:hypothetical protein